MNMLKTLLCLFILIPSLTFAGQAPSADYAKAKQLFSRGKFAEALPLYQKTLADPKLHIATGDIQARIGDCYFQLQEYSNAAKAYRAAIANQKAAQRPVTQYCVGFSVFAQGRDEEAIAEFLKIPSLYPSSGMWVSTAYYWAGRASERLGKKDQAAGYYRKAGGKGTASQEQFAIRKAEEMKGR